MVKSDLEHDVIMRDMGSDFNYLQSLTHALRPLSQPLHRRASKCLRRDSQPEMSVTAVTFWALRRRSQELGRTLSKL